MDFKELQNKTASELEKMLVEKKKELYELRLKLTVNQLKQVREVRQARKDIAMMLTRLNQLKKAEQEAK